MPRLFVLSEEEMKMIKVTKPEECCGCGACAAVCPNQCITMAQDPEGFYYPQVDLKRCVSCGQCERVCPFKHDEQYGSAIQAYAAKNKNEEIRQRSSSGGIFSALAMEVLTLHGVVYGVALDDDCRRVRHIRVEKPEQLERLRGSKYIQAEPLSLYQQIKSELENQILVLFSGTPCQVNALNNFLKKDYNNLFCVDIICHGVPSQKLWEKYIDSLENKYEGIVKRVNFRYKKLELKAVDPKMKTDKNKFIYRSKEVDPYLRMFLKNYSLRPSCYFCRAKLNRTSDLTLADFWRMNEVLPSVDDGKGTSLVLVRTEKGKRMIEKTQGIDVLAADQKKAISANQMEFMPAEKPAERVYFYEESDRISFELLCQKYGRPEQKNVMKKRLRRTWLWRTYKKIRTGNRYRAPLEYGILFEIE